MTMTDQETWINRVQGLIAKAESTDFPEEAEALMAKAQELMTRHAIDLAMLGSKEDRGEPVQEIITVRSPYASARASLLAAIGAVNDVTCVSLGTRNGNQQIGMIGYADDIEATKTLFASLSVQASRFMAATPVPPYDTPRRFRHAFMLGFAGRVQKRLQDARQSAITEAEADGSSVAIVLASKERAVQDKLKELHPSTRKRRASASSASGYSGGRAAADRASIGQRGVAGGQRALGS